MAWTAAEVAQAVWEHAPRTLSSGTADAPDSIAEEIAKAIWEYETRTLTSEPVLPQGAYIPTFRRRRR
jgi:hypothetical protein